jgi:hypothetical protein
MMVQIALDIVIATQSAHDEHTPRIWISIEQQAAGLQNLETQRRRSPIQDHQIHRVAHNTLQLATNLQTAREHLGI